MVEAPVAAKLAPVIDIYGSAEDEPRASEEAGPFDSGICVPDPGRGGCERGNGGPPKEKSQELSGIGVALCSAK